MQFFLYILIDFYAKKFCSGENGQRGQKTGHLSWEVTKLGQFLVSLRTDGRPAGVNGHLK